MNILAELIAASIPAVLTRKLAQLNPPLCIVAAMPIVGCVPNARSHAGTAETDPGGTQKLDPNQMARLSSICL